MAWCLVKHRDNFTFIFIFKHLMFLMFLFKSKRNYTNAYRETSTNYVVLYGCGTWSLTLRREKHRLRVFANRVLRRICGPKREEVAGGWRRLHNEELHNFYVSLNIIRVIK
jgi:hypothetical protein